MPPKKKKKGTITESENAEIYYFLSSIDLKKFCPKKVFDIIAIEETNEETNKIMEKIIAASRAYEEISCVTFITYHEVIDLLNNFGESSFPFSQHAYFLEILGKAKEEYEKTENLPPSKLAQITKLKLMEVMYKHYSKELDKMLRRKTLEDELQLLATDAKKSGGSKKTELSREELKKSIPSSTNMDSKKGKRKTSEKSFFDMDNFNLGLLEMDNDIVFDDDIYSHVWFYVLQGFHNVDLLKELISVYKVIIRAIIRIDSSDLQRNSESEMQSNPYKNFWKTIYDKFYDYQRSEAFENTTLMKYPVRGDNYIELFEGLLGVMKYISDLKLKHIHYIRHIKIHTLEETCPSQCHTFHNALENIPLELVDESIVLSGMLEEVEKNNVFEKYNVSLNKSKYSMELPNECQGPCDISTFVKTNISQHVPKELKAGTFQAHERDFHQIVLKTYRNCGALVVDLVKNVMKTVKPFNILKNIISNFDDIIHKHDIDPGSKIKPDKSETTSHLMYLFLFSTFKPADPVEEDYKENELTENIVTHDRSQFWKSLQPTLVNGNSLEEPSTNLYDPSPLEYVWKEKLASGVMMQELLKVQQSYNYMDWIYSPETDNLLVQLSDHLDDFGLNTEIFDVTISTPVCLRDFCYRVSKDKARWLQEHQPPKYVRKTEVTEQCEGAEKVRSLDIFQSYRHLLEPKVILDEKNNGTGDVKEEEEEEEEEKSASFDYILEQLQCYPTNAKIMEECRGSEQEEHFLAYDFGTKYFNVKGAKTTFASHDNVKITVENTRMIDEAPRFTVNLTCRDNTLTLHSNTKDNFTFHYTLQDGTLITFVLQDYSRKHKQIDVRNSNYTTDELDDEDQNETGGTFLAKSDTKVIDLDAVDFENELNNEELAKEMESFDSNIYSNLKQALVEGCPVYKVNNELNYVEKITGRVEVPLTSVLRRLLHESLPKRQQQEAFSKRYIASHEKLGGLGVKETLDFRICLPNGLYVSCYPSQTKDNLVEVRQEYLSKNPIESEEFRLFTREGNILLKKTDGTITLLKSNGDTLTFEKPDSENEDIRRSNIKQCHCKNINDYTKKVSKIMKRKFDDSQRYVSRRALFATKKGYIISKDLVNILENTKVPYLRMTLVRFEGNETTLEGNKITQKKKFHIISEQDFFAEEIYFEREDGMQSLIDKFGCQIVKFPDGSKITSTIHESSQLMDGYVYISLDFSYEHPYYATVTYNREDSLKVSLNNEVSLERQANDVLSLKIGSDIETKFTETSLDFEKQCNKCASKYVCSFNIRPFLKRNIDLSSQFLHAQDSYNKHFYADFEGNCRRNTDSLNGMYNINRCNHYKKNVYKRLFTVGRTLSGEQFWSDSMVELKKTDVKNDRNSSLSESTSIGKEKLVRLQFRRHNFQNYKSRFFNTSVMREDLCLTKYKKVTEKESLYTTFRVLKKMMDKKHASEVLSALVSHLNNDVLAGTELKMNMLRNSTKDFESQSSVKDEAESVSEVDKEPEKCKCKKIKQTFPEKISRWQKECEHFRQKIRGPIPVYFDSQFCQVIR